MRAEVSFPAVGWRLLVQLFADGVSAAAAHKTRRGVIEVAGALAKVLLQLQMQLGLNVAPPKCRNFLLPDRGQGASRYTEGRLSSAKRRQKAQCIQRMSQDLEQMRCLRKGEVEAELSFQCAYSFRHLGVVLDCDWSFRQHFLELQEKFVKVYRYSRK